MKSYIVELPDGQQFLCPRLHAAQECCEARGGEIVSEIFTRFSEYRYRKSKNGRWGDWPEWTEDSAKVRKEQPK